MISCFEPFTWSTTLDFPDEAMHMIASATY
jgi:hypothetical protein